MVLGGRLWEFTSTHHSQFPLLRMRVLSLLRTSLCISSRRLYPQLWKEVILDSYSCEKKGVLPVEKSSYTWSCRRKISWIPAALERKLLCQNQAVLIKDSYSTEGKGTLAGRSQAVHTAVKGRYPSQLKPWGERNTDSREVRTYLKLSSGGRMRPSRIWKSCSSESHSTWAPLLFAKRTSQQRRQLLLP